jgi:hypothetical protein
VSAMPRPGWDNRRWRAGSAGSLGLLTAAPPIPLGRVQVASKAPTGHPAWERTSSTGQGAGRRYTALTDRLQQG